MSLSTQNKSKRLPLRQLILFAMLGVIMFISKVVMEGLPNIHLLGMLTITYTVVYRWRALIPIYIYVFLNGIFAGFASWWIAYLYVWAILWAATMLIPKRTPKKLACVIYPLLCAAHGLFFGVLCAPAEAIIHHMSFQQTLAWISTGFVFDVIHTFGNLAVGLLVFPLSEALRKLEDKSN